MANVSTQQKISLSMLLPMETLVYDYQETYYAKLKHHVKTIESYSLTQMKDKSYNTKASYGIIVNA